MAHNEQGATCGQVPGTSAPPGMLGTPRVEEVRKKSSVNHAAECGAMGAVMGMWAGELHRYTGYWLY